MEYGPNYKRAMPLSEYLDKRVAVVCTDGCHFVGTLDGFDRFTNLVLRETQERIIGREGTETRDLGAFLLRGETVVTLGLVNEQKDAQINWEKVKGEQINTTRIPY